MIRVRVAGDSQLHIRSSLVRLWKQKGWKVATKKAHFLIPQVHLALSHTHWLFIFLFRLLKVGWSVSKRFTVCFISGLIQNSKLFLCRFLFMRANKLRSVRCSGLDLRLRPTVILALMIHSVLKENEGSCEGPTTRLTREQWERSWAFLKKALAWAALLKRTTVVYISTLACTDMYMAGL